MEAPNQIDIRLRTDQYLQLRDKVAEIKKRHAEELEPYHKTMRQLEIMLLDYLNRINTDATAVRGVGTVYRTEKVSATIADGSAFRDYVIGNNDWDAVDWRPNKTAVKAFVAEHGHAPPGVNYTTEFDVNVRRK